MLQTKTKTLREIFNKADIPEFYDNHQLYYSDVINPPPGSPKYCHPHINYIHIVEPRSYFLKWSNDKYNKKDFELANVSIPWQVLISRCRWSPVYRHFIYDHTKFLAFSHTNILDVPGLDILDIRKEYLFPAYLPNISPAGNICLGDNEINLFVFEPECRLYFEDTGFVPSFKTHLFETSISIFDAFFNGVSNNDYGAYEVRDVDEDEDYEDCDRDDLTYSNWFSPSWTIDQVTSQEFLKQRKKLRFSDALSDWEYQVLHSNFWKESFPESQ